MTQIFFKPIKIQQPTYRYDYCHYKEGTIDAFDMLFFSLYFLIIHISTLSKL